MNEHSCPRCGAPNVCVNVAYDAAGAVASYVYGACWHRWPPDKTTPARLKSQAAGDGPGGTP